MTEWQKIVENRTEIEEMRQRLHTLNGSQKLLRQRIKRAERELRRMVQAYTQPS